MKKKQPRYPDYDVVKLPEGTVTFGTTLFMRKDKQALRIVFPAGQTVTFCPQDEIEKEKAEIRFIKGRLKFINKEDAYKFEVHTPQCATNAAEVADEFAAMGCTCGAKTRISPAPFPSMLVIYGKSPSIYSADKLGKPCKMTGERK